MENDIYKRLRKNPALRFLAWSSPLFFGAYAIFYHHLEWIENYFVSLFSSIIALASVVMLSKQVSPTKIINFLILVLMTSLAATSYFLKDYAVSNLPWLLLPMFISTIDPSNKSRLFWAITSSTLFIIGAYVTFVKVSSLNVEPNKLFLLTCVSLGGTIFLSSILSHINMKFWFQNKLELTNSETTGRMLLRTVVHDISNSLTLIKHAHSVLGRFVKSDRVPPEKALNSITVGLDKASNLVRQIKEMEGLQSGKIELEMTEENLLCLVEECVDSLSHILSKKRLTLDIVEEKQELTIVTNPVSFKISIIENILTNAIKFSPEGETINIKLFEENESVGISILDNGAGIPEDVLKSIFDQNEKSTRLGTRGERGTGFGMLLIEAYCELLGYQLGVSSNHSVPDFSDNDTSGTTISVLIPKPIFDEEKLAS